MNPEGTKKIDLGLHNLLRLKTELTREARERGFTKLCITAMRLSGAKPCQPLDLCSIRR